MFRKIGWELTATYVLIIVFSMAILGVFLLNFIENYFTDNAARELYRQAQLIAEGWPRKASMKEPSPEEIRFYLDMLERISHQTGVRVRILDEKGIPVVDTGGENEPDLSIQPEVTSALKGNPKSGFNSRFLTQSYPIYERLNPSKPKKVIGAVHVSRTRTYLDQILSYIRGQFYLGFSVSMILSLILALLFSHYITKPIVDITQQTDRFAKGRLDQRVQVNSINEIGVLSEKFNLMANALQKTMNQLRGEKNKLAAILKDMAGGVLVIDSEGAIIMVNRIAYTLLGIREKDIIGKKINKILPGHSLLRLLEDSDYEKEIHGDLEDLPEERAVDAHITPVLDEEDRAMGMVVILNDVTEFKRLDRMRTEFVSNVSHELKTPLASIKGLSELLIDGALHEEKATDFLNSINREVDRLTRLVRDLLDLSKMESGIIKMDPVPVNLSDTINQVIMRLTPQAGKKKIQIKTDFKNRCHVLADMDRIQQVLINLLDNAIRYTPRGGGIIVRTSTEEDMCLVEVSDSGPGISQDNMERVFERFFRVDRARTRGGGGFGLGLAITRQIVENHGGRIGVRSKPPKGTTFYFTAPLINK